MIYNTSFVLVSVDISYEDDISTTHRYNNNNEFRSVSASRRLI